MKVPSTVLAVLARATTNGERLYIPGPRLDLRLYQRVDEVLESVGGRWDSQAGAHLFPGDAAEALAPIIATGHVTTLRETRAAAQYFPTPASVIGRLIELARLQPGMRVLEPSAGQGAIAVAVAQFGMTVDCVERDPGHAAVLQETGAAATLTVADFLAVDPVAKYDRVVMNPPFTQQADVAHVTHALQFLKPDGLLVAVMSWSVTFQGGAAAEFRALVEARGGAVEALPVRAFAESGTGVGTVLVTIPAARPADARPVVWPHREVPAPEPEELREPAAIAAEIAADLRAALSIMDDLARDLARPAAPVSKPISVVSALPAGSHEQLAFTLPADAA